MKPNNAPSYGLKRGHLMVLAYLFGHPPATAARLLTAIKTPTGKGSPIRANVNRQQEFSFPIFYRFSNRVHPLLPSRPFCVRHPNLGFRHLIPSAGGPLLAARRIVQSPIWFWRGRADARQASVRQVSSLL
jgi:hypothetical protein